MRSFLRRLGLTKKLAAVFYGRSYEQRYNSRLLSLVQSNDIVWDVGANYGLYTMKFARIVSPTGLVVAFEPNPIVCEQLRHAVAHLEQVRLKCCALGDRRGQTYFSIRGNHGQYSYIDEREGDISVNIETGDYLVQSGELPYPSVVKIDVEGYELEVLKGMRQMLNHPLLRVVAVEVHFRLLQERGLSVKEVVDFLSKSGFACSWVDPSHIIAIRKKAL